MTNAIRWFKGKYAFLSNFAPSVVQLDGEDYPTVEHAFQAAKTSEPDRRREIQGASTPAVAKHRGGAAELRPDWESAKVEIMTGLVRQKFVRDADLAQRLLATGDAELIEGNNWGDRFWGACRGEGRNELGEILMKVRDELRSQDSEGPPTKTDG